jgi:hypothetical protein
MCKKLIYISCLIVLFSCKNSDSKRDGFKENNNIGLLKVFNDTTIFVLDTTMNNVEISGSNYNLKSFRFKYDDNFKKFKDYQTSPVSLVIYENDRPVFYNITEPYENKGFRYEIGFFKIDNEINKPGKLFLKSNITSDGPGYKASLSYLYRDNYVFKLEKLFSFGTESLFLFGNNDSILFFEEIWGEDETMFGCHRYKIKEYSFNDGNSSEDDLGVTKGLYCLSQDKSSTELKEEVSKLFSKESFIFTNTNINSYKKRL